MRRNLESRCIVGMFHDTCPFPRTESLLLESFWMFLWNYILQVPNIKTTKEKLLFLFNFFLDLVLSSAIMWKLASKSIKESYKSTGEDALTKPTKSPSDSPGDRRRTTREDKFECPICWESFNVIENVPYVLWCGHTICKYCLLGLQRAVVIKNSVLPFQLPFFVACPWCNSLSLRLVCNGKIKFPSKNYYLLWMVESMNGCRSESRTSGQRDIRKRCSGESNTASNDERLLENRGWSNGVTRGYLTTRRLHASVCKSMALVAHMLAKFPLVVIFLLMALYAIPMSAAVLGIYFFVTFALAVPSIFVLYFAFPSLNWLVREIAT